LTFGHGANNNMNWILVSASHTMAWVLQMF
jgi:hypothetical protein